MMKKMTLGLALALVGAGLGVVEAGATHPASNGRQIAFSAFQNDGRSAIYLMDPDGGNLRNLTSDLPDNYVVGPWAPDGKSLIVTSQRDALPVVRYYVVDADIYVFLPETRELTPLTQTRHVAELEATWSPTGEQVAFTSARTVGTRGFADTQIEVMDLDGTERRHVADGFTPSWSPDGKRLAYVSWPRDPYDDSHFEIATISVDGSDRSILTKSTEGCFDPDWSPDGRRIVFTCLTYHPRGGRNGQTDLMVIDADGSNLRQLTHTGYAEGFPHWSPDGRFILFNREVGDGDPDRVTTEIFRMPASGRPGRRLTNVGRQAFSAYWQPKPD